MIAYLVAEADATRFEALDRVVAVRPDGPLHAALNAALAELADMPDLEGAVIVGEGVRLPDPDTGAIVHAAFADPVVAVAGVVGAVGVRGLAWWEGTVVRHPGADVDAVDGSVLCLSAWAVRMLRFDAALAADYHGCDVDLCFQARFHGRRVVIIDLAVEHDQRARLDDTDAWIRNELRFKHRWIDRRMITERRHRALER